MIFLPFPVQLQVFSNTKLVFLYIAASEKKNRLKYVPDLPMYLVTLYVHTTLKVIVSFDVKKTPEHSQNHLLNFFFSNYFFFVFCTKSVICIKYLTSNTPARTLFL